MHTSGGNFGIFLDDGSLCEHFQLVYKMELHEVTTEQTNVENNSQQTFPFYNI